MRKFNFFQLLMLLPFSFAFGQSITSVELVNKSALLQYEKAEWNIKVSETFNHPYDQKEVKLDLIANSPSGKPVALPCYFDNQLNVWKARLAPREAGIYSYYFRLTAKNKSSETKSNTFKVQKSDRPGFLHKNDLWTFKFDNGSLFRGIGENVGWEARSFENQKWTYDYLLPTLASNGANFFRTWMCYWNLPLEWKIVNNTKRYSNTNEYFNPGVIKRMDELVNMSDSLNLYFMLSLEWHGHLMEGGGWKNSPYNVVNGGPAKSPTEFFTLQSSMEKYKNKLRYVVARWGYSTSIAAWEFFNEVDNAAFTSQDSLLIPQEAITQWHMEMSRYLKDVDPYQHMVTTSISHRDILGMNSISYIDFNQKHIYKHTEKIPAIYPEYIQTFGKPFVVGEFGFRWEDDDPKYATEFNYDYKRGLWYGMFSSTPILPMTWWWELFDDQKMTPYFRGVRMISDQMLKAGNGQFESIKVVSGLKENYAVKCNKELFVYLLNNTEQTDNGSVMIPVSQKVTKIQSFDPSTLSYKDVSFKKESQGSLILDQVALPSKTEMILIISTK